MLNGHLSLKLLKVIKKKLKLTMTEKNGEKQTIQFYNFCLKIALTTPGIEKIFLLKKINL